MYNIISDYMKYGMPTLIEFKNIWENVEFALKHNLKFIELNMDLPYCLAINKLNLKEYNIEFTMHLSEKLNVASLNNDLRKSYLKEAVREIKLGIKNNIKKYNLHIDSGVYFTLPNGKVFLNNEYLKVYLKNLDKSCKVLNKLALENNIEINFENTKIHPFVNDAVKVISKYDALGFTLDIGHNEKNGDKAYPLFKETNKIRHIHMHDYDGDSDHLEIGKGKIDFHKYEDLLKNNYVVIEVKEKNELINSIDKIKEI